MWKTNLLPLDSVFRKNDDTVVGGRPYMCSSWTYLLTKQTELASDCLNLYLEIRTDTKQDL